ncbi:hypothetical protein ACFQ0M_42205 [Kitasatospora aburaviensis]
MQLHASFRQRRRHLWLPALALAGAALAGCSSGSSKVVAASPAGTATTGTGAPATTAAPSGSAPAAPTGGSTGGSTAAPTAAPTGSPGSDATGTATGPGTGTGTGTAGSRPKDACTLLVPTQVAATINAVEPLNTTRPDAASDGTPVWGCTWGNRQSYASSARSRPASSPPPRRTPRGRSPRCPGSAPRP